MDEKNFFSDCNLNHTDTITNWEHIYSNAGFSYLEILEMINDGGIKNIYNFKEREERIANIALNRISNFLVNFVGECPSCGEISTKKEIVHNKVTCDLYKSIAYIDMKRWHEYVTESKDNVE